MNKPYKTLTDDEYNVLNKISRATRMDVWFFLKQDSHGTDYVWDLEENESLPLKTGIYLLTEGLNCKENYASCNLTPEEDRTFRTLMSKLDIPFDIPYEQKPSLMAQISAAEVIRSADKLSADKEKEATFER